MARRPADYFEIDQVMARYYAEQQQRQQPVRDMPTELDLLRERIERLEGRHDATVVREFPLAVKAVDAVQRLIEGTATARSADHLGDEVVPTGATFTLPLPLLLFHRSDQPVGQVVEANVTADGISVRAKIAEIVEPGEVQTLCDRAWHNVVSGLVSGLSIGFKAIEQEPIKTGYRYKRWRWHELSLVTIPAHPGARIRIAR